MPFAANKEKPRELCYIPTPLQFEFKVSVQLSADSFQPEMYRQCSFTFVLRG